MNKYHKFANGGDIGEGQDRAAPGGSGESVSFFQRLKEGNKDDSRSDAYWKYGAGKSNSDSNASVTASPAPAPVAAPAPAPSASSDSGYDFGGNTPSTPDASPSSPAPTPAAAPKRRAAPMKSAAPSPAPASPAPAPSTPQADAPDVASRSAADSAASDAEDARQASLMAAYKPRRQNDANFGSKPLLDSAHRAAQTQAEVNSTLDRLDPFNLKAGGAPTTDEDSRRAGLQRVAADLKNPPPKPPGMFAADRAADAASEQKIRNGRFFADGGSIGNGVDRAKYGKK